MKSEKLLISNGYPLNALVFWADAPTDKFLVCGMGWEEVGRTEGEFFKLTKYGWPKAAQAGFNCGVNIIVIQIGSGDIYLHLVALMEQLNASAYVLAGLSYSAQEFSNFLFRENTGLKWYSKAKDKMDTRGKLKGFVGACGKYSGGPVWETALDIPIWLVCSEKDPYGYQHANRTITHEINRVPGRKHSVVYTELHADTVKTSNHSQAWEYAYDAAPGKDQVLQWAIGLLNSTDEKPETPEPEVKPGIYVNNIWVGESLPIEIKQL